MRIYIANLGKYNEGELVGAWFTPPVDYDEMAVNKHSQATTDISRQTVQRQKQTKTVQKKTTNQSTMKKSTSKKGGKK